MQTNTETQATEHAAPTGRYAELQKLVAGMAADFQKFYVDGNKAAGTRVRNAMQELKTFAQSVRAEVSQIKNGGAAGAEKDED
jgi:hypothetical protein